MGANGPEAQPAPADDVQTSSSAGPDPKALAPEQVAAAQKIQNTFLAWVAFHQAGGHPTVEEWGNLTALDQQACIQARQVVETESLNRLAVTLAKVALDLTRPTREQERSAALERAARQQIQEAR